MGIRMLETNEPMSTRHRGVQPPSLWWTSDVIQHFARENGCFCLRDNWPETMQQSAEPEIISFAGLIPAIVSQCFTYRIITFPGLEKRLDPSQQILWFWRIGDPLAVQPWRFDMRRYAWIFGFEPWSSSLGICLGILHCFTPRKLWESCCQIVSTPGSYYQLKWDNSVYAYRRHYPANGLPLLESSRIRTGYIQIVQINAKACGHSWFLAFFETTMNTLFVM